MLHVAENAISCIFSKHPVLWVFVNVLWNRSSSLRLCSSLGYYIRTPNSISGTLGHCIWPPAANPEGYESLVSPASYQSRWSWVDQGILNGVILNMGFRQLISVRGTQPNVTIFNSTFSLPVHYRILKPTLTYHTIHYAHKQRNSSAYNWWSVSSWRVSPWTCRGLLTYWRYHHNITIRVPLSHLSLGSTASMFGSCMTLLNWISVPYFPPFSLIALRQVYTGWQIQLKTCDMTAVYGHHFSSNDSNTIFLQR